MVGENGGFRGLRAGGVETPQSDGTPLSVTTTAGASQRSDGDNVSACQEQESTPGNRPSLDDRAPMTGWPMARRPLGRRFAQGGTGLDVGALRRPGGGGPGRFVPSDWGVSTPPALDCWDTMNRAAFSENAGRFSVNRGGEPHAGSARHRHDPLEEVIPPGVFHLSPRMRFARSFRLAADHHAPKRMGAVIESKYDSGGGQSDSRGARP